MQTTLLTPAEILAGYDAVSPLSPHVPSVSAWRAWEWAAYQRWSLTEPALDVGCGDGSFFRLLWPGIRDATGVDAEEGAAARARQSGIYRWVEAVPAHRLPFPPGSFASAFANCSLEHMDAIDGVLASVARSLRPGAPFLLSVVTDRFLDWSTLPPLLESAGEPLRARALQANYEAFHHLMNPLPPGEWATRLERAGFEVLEHVPIAPEATSRLFLFLDQLWNLPQAGGRLGDTLQASLQGLPDFPGAFRRILEGVLLLDRNGSVGSGAAFQARRRA